jgi:hypothetical protein
VGVVSKQTGDTGSELNRRFQAVDFNFIISLLSIIKIIRLRQLTNFLVNERTSVASEARYAYF